MASGEVGQRLDAMGFRWKAGLRDKALCDTFYMLYLLQVAMKKDSIRLKMNGSVGATNTINVISNLLDWHSLDKTNNRFDGKLF